VVIEKIYQSIEEGNFISNDQNVRGILDLISLICRWWWCITFMFYYHHFVVVTMDSFG
jgi:hypothetical protein